MTDNFDIHDWKYNQLISEGTGADLAGDLITQFREKVKTMNSQEYDTFKEYMLQALLDTSEFEMIYPPRGMAEEAEKTEE